MIQAIDTCITLYLIVRFFMSKEWNHMIDIIWYIINIIEIPRTVCRYCSVGCCIIHIIFMCVIPVVWYTITQIFFIPWWNVCSIHPWYFGVLVYVTFGSKYIIISIVLVCRWILLYTVNQKWHTPINRNTKDIWNINRTKGKEKMIPYNPSNEANRQYDTTRLLTTHP